MQSTPIEDVVIGEKPPKKKKGKGLKIIIFLLFIILLVLSGLYWYFVYYKVEETPKQSFIKYIADNNIEALANDTLYREIFNKLNSRSYESNMSVSFSVKNPEKALKNEALNNVDISKFSINWNTIKDNDKQETFNEFEIKYASNGVLAFKTISDEETIAIMSDEIVNKYVGMRTEDFPVVMNSLTGMTIDTTGFNTASEYLNNIDNKNKLDIDSNFKKSKTTKYFNTFFEEIPEENFTKQENFVLQDSNKSVQTTAYILQLDQPNLNTITKQVLTELRNDTELLSKLVTGKDTEDVSDVTLDVFNEPELDPITTSVDGTEFEIGEEPNLDPVVAEDEIEDTEDIESSLTQKKGYAFNINEVITSLIVGQKIDTTLENLQSGIDNYIKDVEKDKGDGLKLTVYVSVDGTEKIDLVLPDLSTLDIVFNLKSERENKATITYLKEEEVFVDDEETDTYGPELQKNGYKIEISRDQRETGETLNIVYGNIKKEKIIQKTNIDLTTTGTMSSKQYKFDLKITYSDNENTIETKINNSLNFDSIAQIENLNEENYILLNSLTQEELIQTLDAIRIRIAEVYAEKIQNLNFINTNNQTPVVEQQETPNQPVFQPTADKETVKQALINKVSHDMGAAYNQDLQYTIQDLENLEVEGHVVSVVLTEEFATITIDGYKFNIDTGFNLTEVE